MKILLQNSVFYPNVIGGAELSSHLLALKLEEKGHHVDALATTGRRGDSAKLSSRPLPGGNGKVYEAASNGYYDIYDPEGRAQTANLLIRGLHHFSALHSRRWLILAGEALDEVQPDILHTNNLVGMTPVIWRAARKRKIPIVHTLRDFHLLCPRTTLLHADHTSCDDPNLVCRLLRRLKLAQTGIVDAVTAPSHFVLQKHLDAGGFPRAQSIRVPNACDGPRNDVPDRRNLSRIRGVFLGQLDTHKGIPILLKALRLLSAHKEFGMLGFDFAGVGPLSEDIKQLCTEHPKRFAYHGHVTGDDKQALLTNAAFLVLPSIWHDNFPRTMLDAFSNGLPVIGANRGGIPEVVGHGKEGVIIEPTVEAVAAAIADYVTDSHLRCRHGAAALKKSARYTLDRQIDGFLEVYRSLAK